VGPLAWLPLGESFQRGQCQPEDFAVGVVSDLGLAITPAELLERFRLWPEALFDGAVELVNAVRARVRVGCFSNTNSVHWDRLRCSWGLDGRCLELGPCQSISSNRAQGRRSAVAPSLTKA
jgi:hypothetical protein